MRGTYRAPPQLPNTCARCPRLSDLQHLCSVMRFPLDCSRLLLRHRSLPPPSATAFCGWLSGPMGSLWVSRVSSRRVDVHTSQSSTFFRLTDGAVSARRSFSWWSPGLSQTTSPN